MQAIGKLCGKPRPEREFSEGRKPMKGRTEHQRKPSFSRYVKMLFIEEARPRFLELQILH